MFKSYWDHEAKERASFTEEEVKRLLDAELMIAGVMRPEAPPPVLTVQDLDLPKKAFARVKFGAGQHEKIAVVFETVEHAEAFLRLRPRLVVDDWETRTVYTKGIEGAAVSTEMFCDEGDIIAAKVELKRIVSKRTEIENKRQEFDEQMRKVDRVTDGVWEDYRTQQANDLNMRKVKSTHDEYLALAQGNADIAMACLRKTFTPDVVEEAANWLDDPALKHVPASAVVEQVSAARAEETKQKPQPLDLF